MHRDRVGAVRFVHLPAVDDAGTHVPGGCFQLETAQLHWGILPAGFGGGYRGPSTHATAARSGMTRAAEPAPSGSCHTTVSTIYATFADCDHAEKAVGALLDYGVRAEDVSLVRKDD